MEIEFSEGLEFVIDKNCEVSYPPYVRHLSVEETSVAKASEEKQFLIVSAGTDPVDNKMLLFTASGEIFLFDARKYHIPDGPSYPSNQGKEIFLPNENGRWPGPSAGFSVDSKWVLNKSVSALAGSTLTTNYRGENKTR